MLYQNLQLITISNLNEGLLLLDEDLIIYSLAIISAMKKNTAVAPTEAHAAFL
jgi:hypothetical protein